MAGAKLEFKNLEYIVMEGGGARGAAYLGAIRALETKMKEHQVSNTLEIFKYNTTGRSKPGLLDYYKKDGDIEIPVIKGIAGSSAGAITTFALALGFNSEEIDDILKYPFKNFLQEKDVGKYRMIDENGALSIGQDKKNKTTKAKELNKDVSDFKFQFDRDKTEIGNNNNKLAIRNVYFTLFTRLLTDGFGANVDNFTKLSDRLNKVPEDLNVPKFFRGGLRFILRFISNFGMQKAANALLLKVLFPLFGKVPFKFDADIAMNALLDRGMFSGFAVREFFMDMVILATTKDTQFQRGFLKFIQDKDKSINQIEVDKIKAELLRIKGFKIGKRSESKLNTFPYFKKYSSYLENLTFKDFNKITGVNFGLCVSNFSSGFPIYFGHEWTPDFRVMEAVAASMTIPPAIKPLYNASDVVKTESFGRAITVQTDTGRVPFVNSKGEFNLSDYYFYEHLVKLALAQELAKPDEKGNSVFINPNNTIDLSAFLPKLKALAYGYFDADKNVWIPADKRHTTEVKSKNIVYTIDHELYLFFYNATYKGLFLDGGYRNNIPFNFFRLRNNNIDSVLAIKLDGSFPPDLLKKVYDKTEKLLGRIDTNQYLMLGKIDEIEDIEELVRFIIPFIEKLDPKEKVTKQDIINQTQAVFDDYLVTWVSDPNIDKKTKALRIRAANEVNRHPKTIKRLALSIIKHYRKQHLTPPWAVPKSILATAFEGYDYGSEKGQVREIADHNQILPLYDCGVGVYDFDMEKVKPMVILAQAKAEDDTLNYFNKPL